MFENLPIYQDILVKVGPPPPGPPLLTKAPPFDLVSYSSFPDRVVYCDL